MNPSHPETLSSSERTVEFDRATVARAPMSPILISEALRLFDLAVIGCSGYAIYFIYVLPKAREIDHRYIGSIALSTFIAAVICQQLRVYSLDVPFARWLGLGRAVTGWALAFGMLLMTTFALKVTEEYSRVWAVSWVLTVAGLFVVERTILRRMILSWAQAGRFANRSLVVGTGEQARRLTAYLQAHNDPCTRIVGFVEDSTAPGGDGSFLGHPLVRGFDRVTAMVRANLVDEVIIAMPWSAEERVRDLTLKLATTPARIRLAPDLVGFQFADRPFTRRAGLPFLKILDRPITGWSFVAKSIEDGLLATGLLVLLAPLMLVIAAAIRLDSPGPVLFRQRRFGFNNEPFEVLKFRTMLAECAGADGAVQATRCDPRITRVGRFLRQWSLDELPQIFNVLRGDMSIVGPRPHAIATRVHGRLFQEVVDGYAARHRVKPGITGWAQVNGWRGETDTIEKIRKRVECDLYYIDNWSVWFDLYIILRTCFVVVRTNNAY